MILFLLVHRLALGLAQGILWKADKDRKGNVFLEPGDVVRCEIEGIGFLENKIITDE
ncbi:MAG: hypothetical protein CM15mP4_4000 [Candidatus Neomarinimicrobiota bacterium]|nr:MAG: hypothetical protein CM15mP4_4000 [Candidatus Neomarinimicrobiota bacterium]